MKDKNIIEKIPARARGGKAPAQRRKDESEVWITAW